MSNRLSALGRYAPRITGVSDVLERTFPWKGFVSESAGGLMTVIDQPSVLAVCIPGVRSDMDVADMQDLLAEREKAAQGGHITAARCDSSLSKCDACDDSACGLDAIGEASIGLSDTRGIESARTCQPSFFHADSGKKALELLRMLRFDLLVTGDELPDMPVGHLIRRVRAAWPWQKWTMVGSSISPQDEIAARTLGALAVFDAPADWDVLGGLAAAAAGKADALNLNRSQMEPLSSMHVANVVNQGSRVRKPSRPADRAIGAISTSPRRSATPQIAAKRSVG